VPYRRGHALRESAPRLLAAIPAAAKVFYLGPALGDADNNFISCARVVARGCRTHAVVSERREYRRLRHRIGVRFQLAHPG